MSCSGQTTASERLIPMDWVEAARRWLDHNAETAGEAGEARASDSRGAPTGEVREGKPLRQRLRSPRGWAAAALRACRSSAEMKTCSARVGAWRALVVSLAGGGCSGR